MSEVINLSGFWHPPLPARKTISQIPSPPAQQMCLRRGRPFQPVSQKPLQGHSTRGLPCRRPLAPSPLGICRKTSPGTKTPGFVPGCRPAGSGCSSHVGVHAAGPPRRIGMGEQPGKAAGAGMPPL